MSAIARFVRAVDALNEGVGRLVALVLLLLIALVGFEVTRRYGF